jgi:hypothetical protein
MRAFTSGFRWKPVGAAARGHFVSAAVLSIVLVIVRAARCPLPRLHRGVIAC